MPYENPLKTLVREVINLMFRKNPDGPFQEVCGTINLPRLLSPLSEGSLIYHDVKIKHLAYTVEQNEGYVHRPNEEYGKGFVNSFYQEMLVILGKNPDLP